MYHQKDQSNLRKYRSHRSVVHPMSKVVPFVASSVEEPSTSSTSNRKQKNRKKEVLTTTTNKDKAHEMHIAPPATTILSSLSSSKDQHNKMQEEGNVDTSMIVIPTQPSPTTNPSSSNDNDNIEKIEKKEDLGPLQPQAVTPDTPKSIKTCSPNDTMENENPIVKNNDDNDLASDMNFQFDHPNFSPPTTKGLVVVGNRSRCVSLDRPEKVIFSGGGGSSGLTITDNNFTYSPNGVVSITEGGVTSTTTVTTSGGENDDDEYSSSVADSSDGESSYFAKHLPSPKSGRRRFSYSSTHSAPARTRFHNNDNNNITTTNNTTGGAHHHHHHNHRSSDASLSFSDESDESDDEFGHMTNSESPGPVSQLPPQVADMQLQRITRMHSVSSLVSSGSEEGPRSPQSTLSRDSLSSDPSISAELSTVKAKSSSSKNNGGQTQQNGRISPLPANPAFMGGYYGPSPPTIMPGYTGALDGMPHPQPHHMMTQEQLASWMAAQQQRQHGQMASRGSSSKSSGDGALPFVYSDDETDDSALIHHLANGHPSGSSGHGHVPHDTNDSGYNTFGAGGGEGRNNNGADNGGGGRHFNPHGGNNGLSGGGGGGKFGGQGPFGSQQNGGVMAAYDGQGGDGHDGEEEEDEHDKKFKLYWQRWIMLFYMSVLNLLSDWTCYSVAPIAILTQQTFGDIDPERLVVIFLGANAIATACEPIILARLGLRKTVLFGALFLMLGSMIKSGGIPPIIEAQLVKGQDEWRLNLGFFLVGLSQPLYQCTPALLSAAWFPEQERTMATGVALNANQLGIGFAFIFGTLLVASSEDIPNYFGLLSIVSTLAFLGTLIQFDDAPPTPPSDTAKVMKGDIDINSIFNSVKNIGVGGGATSSGTNSKQKNQDQDRSAFPQQQASEVTRRRPSPTLNPSNALYGSTAEAIAYNDPLLLEAQASAPSPMMPGPTQQPGGQANQREGNDSPLYDEQPPSGADAGEDVPPGMYPMYPGMPYGMPPPGVGPYNAYPPQGYPYYDPRMQQQQQQQHPLFQQPQPGYYYPPPPQAYYYGYQNAPPMYGPPGGFIESYPGEFDDGAEPEINVSPHHLDINIRDDQVIRSIKACFSRPGFIHCLVSFTVSGIVINTLSTFMDYLVTLNGAGRQYVGIVGGSFQGIIMVSLSSVDASSSNRQQNAGDICLKCSSPLPLFLFLLLVVYR